MLEQQNSTVSSTVPWYKKPKCIALVVATGLAAYGVSLVAWLQFAPESFLLQIASLWGGGQ